MKLAEFVGNLQQLMINDPQSENLDVVFTDSEGNEFEMIFAEPSVGNFEDGDLLSDGPVNAVCIN